jgi:hypothetical protein
MQNTKERTGSRMAACRTQRRELAVGRRHVEHKGENWQKNGGMQNTKERTCSRVAACRTQRRELAEEWRHAEHKGENWQ